jgi:uncharacterized repeat protein (TIGR03803 family)
MRTLAIATLLGVACITGCAHAASTLPQPNGVTSGVQSRPGVPTAGPPTHYVVLYRFQGGADGREPLAGLVRDAAGNLYGTTARGGSTSCPNGCGVVFKVDPSGHESVLHAFTNAPDGKAPEAGLLLDATGNLYGTTSAGGPTFMGTVFKLDPSGHETLLHGWGTGVGDPQASLIADAAGDLYGTAEFGGTKGQGSVFKIDTSGNYSDLFSFDVTDGYIPHSRLVRDPAGNLYGTTVYGGTVKCDTFEACGVVFQVAPNGNETVLHNFASGTDGAHPDAGLVRDAAGNLYGTTRGGGSAGGCSASSGCGVVFKLDLLGNETILFRFKGKSGENPRGDLVRDADGNLFGTTSRGGALGFGTVFRLDPTGNETVLHSFSGADGGPDGGVIRDGSGNLYGTAQYPSGDGVVFELTH